MQPRLVSPPPYYRLPHRVEPVSSYARIEGEARSRQQAGPSGPANPPARIPANTASANARHEYYYSRVEAVVGRTANAIKSYTDVEDGAIREQLQAQLGLDIYV